MNPRNYSSNHAARELFVEIILAMNSDRSVTYNKIIANNFNSSIIYYLICYRQRIYGSKNMNMLCQGFNMPTSTLLCIKLKENNFQIIKFLVICRQVLSRHTNMHSQINTIYIFAEMNAQKIF